MSTLRVNNIEKLTSNKLFIKSDTNLSGSLQLTGSLEVTGQISGSFYGDGSNLLGVTSYTDSDTLSYINSLGVLSGSIDWNTLEGKPSGIVSSSAQLSTEISGAFVSTSASLASSISNNDSRLTTLEGKTLISSSAQITITESQISDLTHYTDSDTLSYINTLGVVSSSAQLSNQTIPGDLTIGGKITAQEFHTEFVSASIIYQSGSTQFGDTVDDTHTFIGILSATTIQNVISSSAQITITESQISDLSHYTDSDTLSYINTLGVVSSSAQLSTEISGAFISVSSSLASAISTNDGRLTTLEGKTLVSGSSQITYGNISSIPSGIVSSSAQVDYNSIQNQPTIPTNNNQLTNGAGYTTCVGDITGVTAGTGLGGGGTSGDVTLSVNADQRGNVTLIGADTNDYIQVGTTVIDFRLDGALDMRLENDGDLHVDGNVIAYSTTTSDERLKDNIETLNNSLDNIRKLRGVSYVWKKGGREGQKDIGVIAQEIEKIFPELVREVKLPTLDIEDTTKYKTVDYDKLSPILIEAIKELSNRLEHLENKINSNGTTE